MQPIGFGRRLCSLANDLLLRICVLIARACAPSSCCRSLFSRFLFSRMWISALHVRVGLPCVETAGELLMKGASSWRASACLATTPFAANLRRASPSRARSSWRRLPWRSPLPAPRSPHRPPAPPTPPLVPRPLPKRTQPALLRPLNLRRRHPPSPAKSKTPAHPWRQPAPCAPSRFCN